MILKLLRKARSSLTGRKELAGRFMLRDRFDVPLVRLCTPRFFDSLGLDVDCVTDVGVQRSSRWLYEAFLNRHFLLVDPFPSGHFLFEVGRLGK